MQRRDFLKGLSLGLPLAAAGCRYMRIDKMSVFIRSDFIESPEQEQAILKKAKLEWTEDGRIRVLYLRGSAYERGYQHGKLLRQEIADNIQWLYDKAVDKFKIEELFDESYERMRPFIPQEYIDEMHGLAHGSRLPLKVIHGVHALPEIGEWGGKKHIKKVVKQMMDGELGTSCSNFCTEHKATANGAFYSVRILDWGLHRISKLHQYPLIAVSVPDHGQAYANIGWIGFIGAISGMNEQGITLGEMGYGDPEGETLRGKPMPFLLRDILAQAKDLKDVRRIIKDSPGTNSFVFLMSDGKAKKAEMYVRDRSRFVIFKPGEHVTDGKVDLQPIDNILYGGHYPEKMKEMLSKYNGQITVDLIQKEIIPKMVMPSNFQNVIYEPGNLKFWVANAKSKTERAADQPYTYFDFGAGLRAFKAQA